MRKVRFFLLTGCFLTSSFLFGQEVLLPLVHSLKDNQIFFGAGIRSFDRETPVKPSIYGNGTFPVEMATSTYLARHEKDTARRHNWFFRKLFREHFVQQQGENFLLLIDPLLDVQLGKEALQNTPEFLFQNTRGIQATAVLGDKFTLYTAFYENQARFAPYQTAYFVNRGEIYVNPDYIDNAVIPNGGRTKPFKTTGFDYASAISYVRFTPLKNLIFQFGNAPKFVGWGYRSLLLSDNSYNYTQLSAEWRITKKISYSFMRGKQLNLIRKPYTSFVEKPYERKGIGTHYLNFKILPSLSLGLFEASVYLRDEGEKNQRVNPYFYQPIIGVNTLANGAEKADIKNLVGLNFAWSPKLFNLIYGQIAIDDFKNTEYGFQLGYQMKKHLKKGKFFFQVELNKASSLLYAAENERMSYTHFNLPLAHTLGNNFTEIIFRGRIDVRKIFIDGKAIYYTSKQPIESKTTVFSPKSNPIAEDPIKVLNLSGEIGYTFNEANQLQVFAGATYRVGANAVLGKINYGIVTLGFRTNLRNSYFDF